MVTKDGRGRSRRANPIRRMTDAAKRSTAFLVCVSLIAGSMLGSFVSAADEISESPDEEAETEIYSMEVDSLCEALEDAVRNGEAADEDELEFSGSSADKYEKLFDTKDGLLYEIYPALDEEGDSLTLRTFAKIEKSDIETASAENEEDEEEDLVSDYNVTGNEEIIFLLVNNTDDEVSARIHVTTSDEVYETKKITVPGNESSSSITLDTLESMDTMEYIVIDEKEENVETAELKVETDNDAEEAIPSESSKGSTSAVATTTVEETAETPSNAVKVNVSTYTEGCTALSGTIYDATTVNGQSAVAFETSLGKLGIDYGIVVLDDEDVIEVSTAADLRTYLQASSGTNYHETVKLMNDITLSPSGEYITISAKHTLDLNGFTISFESTGSPSNGVLFVNTTEPFTVKNGTFDGSNGLRDAVIKATGAVSSSADERDITIEDVTFENFYGDGQSRANAGHAIVYVTYGDLTVTGCTFKDNNRSAIFVSGDGSYSHGAYGTVTIENSTFTNNDSTADGTATATNGLGGAVRIEQNVAEVIIEGNAFTGNTASQRGAGLYVTDVTGDVTIKGNEFTGNKITMNGNSDPNGGAGAFIGDVHGDLLFSGNTVSGNTLENNGSNLRNYGAGVLYYDTLSSHTGTSYVFEGNTITNNINKDEPGSAESKGGGISVGGVNDPDQLIEIKSGTVSGNKADFGGGIDYSYEGKATLKLYNAIITDNKAGISGGGFWACPAATTTLYQTYGGTIYGNTADTMADTIRFEGLDGTVYPGLSGGTFVSVNPRALGGTLIDWYTDDADARRDEAVDVVNDDRFHDTNLSFSLYGSLSEKGIELAEAEAALIVAGNEAYRYGGGMASNSPVEFGDNESKKLTVIKKWVDDQGREVTAGDNIDSVRVKLIRIAEDGTTEDLETITLNADNNWTHTFTDLPANYDYKVIEVPEAAYDKADYVWSEDEEGNPIVTITNDKKEGLVIGKQVNGNTTQDEFSFKITLSDSEGNPINGDVSVRYYYAESSDNAIMADRTGVLTFEDGEAEVTLTPNERINLTVANGTKYDVEELPSEEPADETYVSLNGTVTKAKAASGTVADSSEVLFINSYREYFDIDEEIIPDMDDAEHRDTWVKSESVNEYGALEFEMSTKLPVVTPDDVRYGEFTMLFHNVLDEGLKIDAEENEDLHITIGGQTVPADYYTVEVFADDDDKWTIAPLSIVDNDNCTFHVTVELTRLYLETDIVNDEELLSGDTEIIIYFYVDLEGEGMDGQYKSTVQYQIFDEEELLYTSSESVVYVYTYEIEINKYDSSTGEKVSGAEFGIYTDEDLSNPVMRYGEAYTDTSDGDGIVKFYGLAAGTYYVKELKAPAGYELSDKVLKIELGSGDSYRYNTDFANTPTEPEPYGGTNSLSVKKTVTGTLNNSSYANREYSFTVTLSGLPEGKTVTGTRYYADGTAYEDKIAFDESGAASFVLKKNEYALFDEIPDGVTYEVTETTTGYVQSVTTGAKTGTVDGAVSVTINNAISGGGSSGGSGGSGGSSGGGTRPGTDGGPGADTTTSETSGSTSSTTINTDDIGELPATGESNTAMALIAACVVLAAVLVLLLYLRRRPSDV